MKAIDFRVSGMRFIVLFFLFFLCNATQRCLAQTFESLYQEGLSNEKIPNESLALSKYIAAQKLQPLNLLALYKCSELYCRVGARESNIKSRDKYFETALAYAKIAVKNYPNTDDANVSMGIALGKIALTKTGSEKIEAVKDIKIHAEKALALNPNNFKAWHIIGKWNYEISNLNFFERSAIVIFYGGLPDASFDAAIAAYEKARSLSYFFCLNHLELAKAYVKAGSNLKAKMILQQLMTIPNQTEDDPRIKQEATKLMKLLE